MIKHLTKQLKEDFFFLAHSSGTVVYPGGSMVPEASGNCLLSVTKEGETGSMVSL